MKKTIEQQIAELTPEQKSNMGKVYTRYTISLICVFLIGILIGFFSFSHFSTVEEKAKERYDRIQTQIMLNSKSNKLDLSLYDESSDARNEYYDAKQLKPVAIIIGGGVVAIGAVAVYFVFRKKYPYFSEKKYTYLKKTANAEK